MTCADGWQVKNHQSEDIVSHQMLFAFFVLCRDVKNVYLMPAMQDITLVNIKEIFLIYSLKKKPFSFLLISYDDKDNNNHN